MSRRGLVAIQTALFALTILAAVAIPTGSAGADVSQTPVVTGCPAGFPQVSIQELETAQGHPYPLAERIDRTGNQNGLICARQVPDGETKVLCGPDCPIVLFRFGDDNNPAQFNAQAG
jgi:hypothetical protein